MEKSEILEKLREYEDSISIDINKTEQNSETELKDVIYLGEVTWKDKVNNEERSESLYIVKKEIIDINKDEKEEIKKVNNYYLGNKCIGAYLEEGKPYFTSTIEEDKLQAVKKLLAKNAKESREGISLEKLQNEELENIIQEINKKNGIELKKEDIQGMSEIDLEHKLEKTHQDKNVKELSKRETKKLTDDKQELKINTKVDDKKTLGQTLNLDSGEYIKIAIVYSDRLNYISNNEKDSMNNTRYSFVAVKKDGTAQIINDRLEIDSSSGNNSYKEAIKVDADKTARKDNKTLSRYKISGKDEYLSVENGQYGEVKAYYGKGKTKDGNMSVETQLETTNVRPTSRELRDLQADRHGTYNTDNMAKEANEHFDEHGEEEIGINAVDGNPDTVDKQDVDEISDDYIQKMVDEFMGVQEIDEVFTRREVEERTVRFFKDKNDIKNIEYLKQQLKQDIELDAEYMHTRGERQ